MNYKIGTTLVGMVALDEFANPLPVPNSQWMQYQEIVELANGRTRGIGSQRTYWKFELIEDMDARNELKTYCPGSCADVFIATLQDDGTYANYAATMRWPLDETQENGWVLGLTIEFTNLVAQA